MVEFFQGRKLRYEIHLLVDKRWQITEIVGDGRDAGGVFVRSDFEDLEKNVLAKANALLAAGVKAVRVLRDRVRDDGFTTTTEIFFKEASGGKSEPPIAVGRHDGEAPLCETPDDLAARPACKVIGVVLRGFLDKQIVTALELLHFHPYIRKLNDNHSLLQGAVHQIATAQAKAAGGEAKSRAATLHELIEAVEGKAREAMAEKRPPTIEQGDFAKFGERIAARYEGGQRRFHTLVGIARHFQGAQSFLARLDFALDHFPAVSPEMGALLDEFAAGCLDSSQLVMDLLGHQPSLAAALTALAELACGRGEGGAEGGSLARLRSLIAEGKLPLTAESLWDRVLRELGRGRPLSRSDEKQEWNLLMKLSDHLLARCPADRKAAINEAVKQRTRRLREAALMRE